LRVRRRAGSFLCECSPKLGRELTKIRLTVETGLAPSPLTPEIRCLLRLGVESLLCVRIPQELRPCIVATLISAFSNYPLWRSWPRACSLNRLAPEPAAQLTSPRFTKTPSSSIHSAPLS